MNRLRELSRHGQSYWLDNLTRGKIEGGELARRIREEDLRGVTSNPAIFHKAISGGEAYDRQLRELVDEDLSNAEMYERLVVRDIQDACDVLRSVYDATDGGDGFVSLEVSPHLIHDTEATMAEARRLFAEVDRPNVLIKIPGSPAGVPAVEQMLYEGVNINITLLFSIEAYEAVAKAYIRALERRASERKSIDDVASVASFFLSRIDTLVDSLLVARLVEHDAAIAAEAQYDSAVADLAPKLRGRAAIANAKLAYQSFRRTFAGERWEALAAAGARVQRVLWASTSTKNPAYPDLKYVEPLVGPHTINTMPDETAAAFADHGRVVAESLLEDVEAARETMSRLTRVGIDFETVTEQLLEEGADKFIRPYDALLATLAERRDAIAAESAPTTR